MILAITGCSNNPPLKSSVNVPKVSELKALSDRNAIALEWNLVDKQNIAGYYIQRSEDNKDYKQIVKIENRYVTHWTDVDLQPSKSYFYKISTFTDKGVPSFATLKRVSTAKTISPISYIADSGLRVKGMVKFIFRPSQNERVVGYYIEKFKDKSGKWERIATLKPRLRAEFIDKNLIDGQIYKYRVISFTFDGLESKPSKVVSIKTLSKPKIVTDLKATTNLPKEIKLNWAKIANMSEYLIYSSDSQDGNYNLLARTKNSSFIDKIGKDGVSRYYKVTSLDKYGIESVKPKNPVMGSTLDIPLKPIVSIDKGDNTITFTLSSSDQRAEKYRIVREGGEKSIKYLNVKSGFQDKKLKPKIRYNYKVYSVDKYGLVSKPTELEVTF